MQIENNKYCEPKSSWRNVITARAGCCHKMVLPMSQPCWAVTLSRIFALCKMKNTSTKCQCCLLTCLVSDLVGCSGTSENQEKGEGRRGTVWCIPHYASWSKGRESGEGCSFGLALHIAIGLQFPGPLRAVNQAARARQSEAGPGSGFAHSFSLWCFSDLGAEPEPELERCTVSRHRRHPPRGKLMHGARQHIAD